MRFRYAPSPTGYLHIGGIRTALFNYLLAKKFGDKFIVRFEDTDQNRHIESGINNQLDGLKWLGINWDESVDVGGDFGPYRQIERLDLYQPFIDALLQNGDAYYCNCQVKDRDIEDSAIQAHSCDCHKRPANVLNVLKSVTPDSFSIRFKVPNDELIKIKDAVRDEVVFSTKDIGDFVIVRLNGIPTYNLAVVLDDHLMGINVVVRGEEHLTNTPKQILIYNALGFKVPAFAHLPLILNTDRKKMSKRDASLIQFVNKYQELGYIPEAIVNFVALLGWSPGGEEEIFTMDELIKKFSFDRISKAPAVFDMKKLNAINHKYIMSLDFSVVRDNCIKQLQKAGYFPESYRSTDVFWVDQLAKLYIGQLDYFAQIVDFAKIFFVDKVEYAAECSDFLNNEQAKIVLDKFLKKVESVISIDPDHVKMWIKDIQQETGIKGPHLYNPIRSVLTGQIHGRDLDKMIYLLGKEKVIARLQNFMEG